MFKNMIDWAISIQVPKIIYYNYGKGSTTIYTSSLVSGGHSLE